MPTDRQLLDCDTDVGENVDGLFFHHHQLITSDFVDSLKNARNDSVQSRCGDYHRIASVPTFVIELWMRQGIDVDNMTPREVVTRLRREGLHHFITSDKSV